MNLNLRFGAAFVVGLLLAMLGGLAGILLGHAVLAVLGAVVLPILLGLALWGGLWKWQALQPWLIPYPDLNGTWAGEIDSDYEKPETGQRFHPYPTTMTIRQDLQGLRCTVRTETMHGSISFGERFIRERGQVLRLVHSYHSPSQPDKKEKSPDHKGTTLFEVVVEDGKIKLKGEYWTERSSNGRISFSKYSANHLDEFPEKFKVGRKMKGKPKSLVERKQGELRGYIKGGELERALSGMVKACKEFDRENLEKEATVLFSRFKRVSKDFRSGTLSRQDVEEDKDRITESLLEMIKLLPTPGIDAD